MWTKPYCGIEYIEDRVLKSHIGLVSVNGTGRSRVYILDLENTSFTDVATVNGSYTHCKAVGEEWYRILKEFGVSGWDVIKKGTVERRWVEPD